jgi:hypothetical protein
MTTKAQRRAAREEWRQNYCREYRQKANKKHGPCKSCGGDATCPDDQPECILSPWKPNCCTKKNGVRQTPHHIVPKHCFMDKDGNGFAGSENYSASQAPCICVTGKSKVKTHGKIHDDFDKKEDAARDSQNGVWTYQQARTAGVNSTAKVTGCPEACLRSQLDAYHKKKPEPGIENDTLLRADSTGKAAISPALSSTASGTGF